MPDDWRLTKDFDASKYLTRAATQAVAAEQAALRALTQAQVERLHRAAQPVRIAGG